MILNSFHEIILDILHGAVKHFKEHNRRRRRQHNSTEQQPVLPKQHNGSVERKATQKLPIPILEKNDHTSANLWWRKFVQYIKMTRDIDVSTMTYSKEILPQFRERLEEEIRDVFIWAIGQSAITEMTKTVREKEPNSLPLYQLYTLFGLHFFPERNKHHSRADFFNLKREPGESAVERWKHILEFEKNCEFEEIKAAELLASKFLSVTGKKTGDKILKEKQKSNTWIEKEHIKNQKKKNKTISEK